MSLSIVEGWTERVIYQLNADGAPIDLTGLAVVLVAHDKLGNPVTFTGNIGLLNPPGVDGKVYFDPAPGDFVASLSPLSVRWKITDGDGKVAFFPRFEPGAPPETWIVSPQ